MNIGILTFHYAHNYGAVLQAYALKTYLESLGHVVTILDYRNKHIVHEYPKNLKPRFPKKYIFNTKKWGYIHEDFERCFYSRVNWKNRYIKFEMFIATKLLNKSSHEWVKLYKESDALFFGSDQIWEVNIVGEDEKVYFGELDTNSKKISYAASCFDPNRLAQSKKIASISRFDYISTREETLAEILRDYYPELNIQIVADPVFLLEKEEYLKIATKKDEQGYILAYFVTENKNLSKVCEYLRNVEKKEVIEIHYFNTKKICNKYQITDVGPEEFLGYLLGANEILTNSFHGTAFSIIFGKQFWSFSNNIRIVDVLKKIKLQNRQVVSYDDWIFKKNSVIDYSEINRMVEKLRINSKEYIKNTLSGGKREK